VEGGCLGGGVRPPLRLGVRRALSGVAKWSRGRFQKAAKATWMTGIGWASGLNLVNQMALSHFPGMAIRSLFLSLVFGSALVGCTSVPDTEVGPPRVEIADLVAAPEKYEGMRTRIEGWAVRSFEDYNLYPSRAAAFGRRGKSNKVGAEWDDSHLTYRTMRKGVFDATFRNRFSRSQPDGPIIISTAMSFGPLEDIRVVEWKSGSSPPCG